MTTSSNKNTKSSKDNGNGGEWITSDSPKQKPRSKTPAKSTNDRSKAKTVTPAAGHGTTHANRYQSPRDWVESKGKEETKDKKEEETEEMMEEKDDKDETHRAALGQSGRAKAGGRKDEKMEGEDKDNDDDEEGEWALDEDKSDEGWSDTLNDLVDTSEAESTIVWFSGPWACGANAEIMQFFLQKNQERKARPNARSRKIKVFPSTG